MNGAIPQRGTLMNKNTWKHDTKHVVNCPSKRPQNTICLFLSLSHTHSLVSFYSIYLFIYLRIHTLDDTQHVQCAVCVCMIMLLEYILLRINWSLNCREFLLESSILCSSVAYINEPAHAHSYTPRHMRTHTYIHIRMWTIMYFKSSSYKHTHIISFQREKCT